MDANALLNQLRRTSCRLVLAESCTGGAVAAALAAVPGASDVLAGSMVVYQNASKVHWLDIDDGLIQRETAVSEPVARAMVHGALHRTPHANVAAVITGHLGPNAPEGFDGVAFMAFGRIDTDGGSPAVICRKIQMKENWREARQSEVASRLIQWIVERLADQGEGTV